MIVLLDELNDEFAYQKDFKAKEVLSLDKLIIFLDFDGVLHPFGSAEKDMFSKVPDFENLLRRHKFTQVVFSTSWISSHSLDNLRSLFSEDIRGRFIGAIEDTDNRGKSCREWLKANELKDCPWIALDDIAVFAETDPVVRTNLTTGLSDASLQTLEEAIKNPMAYQKFMASHEEMKRLRKEDGISTVVKSKFRMGLS